MASRGCRDKYIKKNAVLTHQLQNDKLIQQLDQLRQDLYIALGSPFQLQLVTEDNDGTNESYRIGQYIIWQEDKQAELIGYQNFNIPLQYTINVYKQVLDKLVPGVIQLQLPINIILVDFVKKKRVRIKKNKVVDINVIQLQLGLVG